MIDINIQIEAYQVLIIVFSMGVYVARNEMQHNNLKKCVHRIENTLASHLGIKKD